EPSAGPHLPGASSSGRLGALPRLVLAASALAAVRPRLPGTGGTPRRPPPGQPLLRLEPPVPAESDELAGGPLGPLVDVGLVVRLAVGQHQGHGRVLLRPDQPGRPLLLGPLPLPAGGLLLGLPGGEHPAGHRRGDAAVVGDLRRRPLLALLVE